MSVLLHLTLWTCSYKISLGEFVTSVIFCVKKVKSRRQGKTKIYMSFIFAHDCVFSEIRLQKRCKKILNFFSSLKKIYISFRTKILFTSIHCPL
jgi:hypothetical protein